MTYRHTDADKNWLMKDVTQTVVAKRKNVAVMEKKNEEKKDEEKVV